MGYLFYRQGDSHSGFGIDLASIGSALALLYLAVLLVTAGPRGERRASPQPRPSGTRSRWSHSSSRRRARGARLVVRAALALGRGGLPLLPDRSLWILVATVNRIAAMRASDVMAVRGQAALARLARPLLPAGGSACCGPASFAGSGENELVVGQLGGVPILPDGLAWPQWDGYRPLTFVAEIDCRQLPSDSLSPAGESRPVPGPVEAAFPSPSQQRGRNSAGTSPRRRPPDKSCRTQFTVAIGLRR